MAEVIAAIGVVASVAQLAEYGFKLSIKLFTFSQAVSTADQSIKGISNDVSLTSTVLQELCHIIKSDESHVVSPRAVAATQQTVRECLQVFEQLNDALDKSLGNLGKLEAGDGRKVKRGTIALERLKWPFKQPKMELMRSNLDRLKASLTLMLQVLSYARDVSNNKAAAASLAYQQHLIESLARSEIAMKRKYYSLAMAIEDQRPPPAFNTTTINMSAEVMTARGIADSPQHLEPASPPVVKPRTLIGELLLCFQLLNDIVGYHMAVMEYTELSVMGYSDLRIALEKIQLAELKRLEAEYGDTSIYIKSEAAQNLHTRLRELARAGYLEQRVHEDPVLSRKMKASDERIAPVPSTEAPESIQIEEVARVISARLDYFNGLVKDSTVAGDKQEATPYRQSISGAPTADRTSTIQAQIDDTVGVMRENIDKVLERGERLDALSNKTDNLSVSSQAFRRDANRDRKLSPWKSVYAAVTDNVARLSTESYKTIQDFSGSVYEAGTTLFSKSKNEDEISNEGGYETGNTIGGNLAAYDEGEGIMNENIVGELLAEWTTLPLQEHHLVTVDAQIENE